MAMPVKSRTELSRTTHVYLYRDVNCMTLLAALLATIASLLFLSCSARKPILPSHSCFRLEAVSGGDSLLLTPAIPQANTATAPIKMTLKSSPASPSLHCFVEEGDFRIEQGGSDAKSVRITMPSAEIWLHNLEVRLDPPSDQAPETLFAILADLDKLHGEGCFHTTVSIRDLILQSLPMRPADSLFNGYGYLAGRTGLDLKPGMRLRVERAYFQAPESAQQQHTPQLFLGVSTLYFSVLDNGGGLRFRQQGTTAYRPASLVKQVFHQHSDLPLSSIQEENYFRLLFRTYFASSKHSRSTAIIGAGKMSELDELDRELHAHPDENCKKPAVRYRAVCFGFEGDVTVTPQIRVELNGKRTFVDWGTKIKDVLPNTDEQTLKSLTLQRQFIHAFYDLQFEPTDSHVLSLSLIAGDRMTWSNTSARFR